MTSNPNKNTSILVVDDDKAISTIVTTILKSEGYHVITAENGEEAIDIVKQSLPDLIMLDVIMPGIDGFETCTRLRKFTDQQATPVVMMTGKNDIQSIEKAFSAGANEFISKPINLQLLAHRIRFILKSKQNYVELLRNQQRIYHVQQVAQLGYLENIPGTDNYHISDEAISITGLQGKDNIISRDDFVNIVSEYEQTKLEQLLISAEQYQQPFILDCDINTHTPPVQTISIHSDVNHNLHDNSPSLTIVIQDITQRKQANALIEHQRTHDILTDLPNRTSFTEQLQLLIFNQHHTFSICLLQIDRIKNILESLGPNHLDQLILAVAARLEQQQSTSVKLFQVETGQFALLIRDVSDEDSLNALTDSIQALFSQPFEMSQYALFLTISIGVIINNDDTSYGIDILKNAESALNRAIMNGGNTTVYYNQSMNASALNRLQLESELRNAVKNDEIKVFYQAKIDSKTRQVVGMEALARWQHPERGLISPLDFIPIAEETGLIVDIGKHVLHTACMNTVNWNKHGFNLKVAVNLSTKQFIHAKLLEDIKQTLDETGLPASMLELEVTESLAMGSIEESIRILNDIHDLDISISIDDFGTGYSSLSYLQKLPVHTVKIDRAFVRDIDEQGNHSALAKTIINMAHNLGLNTVAEGVEYEHQCELLQKLGCDQFQGFLFAKPLPEEEFNRYLLGHHAA